MSQTDINVSGQQETPVVMATEASAIRRCSILPEGNARSASEGGKCLADRPKTLSLSRGSKKGEAPAALVRPPHGRAADKAKLARA